MESVGDQSSYVAELLRHVNGRAEEILPYIHKQQYARAYCDNLVGYFSDTFLANIVQCRPISEVGAEQVNLYSFIFTTFLLTASRCY
jgi:hypothetical protein